MNEISKQANRQSAPAMMVKTTSVLPLRHEASCVCGNLFNSAHNVYYVKL